MKYLFGILSALIFCASFMEYITGALLSSVILGQYSLMCLLTADLLGIEETIKKVFKN